MPPPSPTLRVTVVGLLALAIAMGVGRFAFTPLLPLMRADGLIGIADGGVLASVHFIGYALGAVLAMRFHYRPRTTLRASLIAIGLSTLGMGLSESVPLWMALRGLAGVASAFTLVLVSSFTIRHLATIGRADRQGWVFAGVGAGIAITGLGTLAMMAAGIGGPRSWQCFGMITMIAAVAVSFAIGAEIPEGCDAPPRRQGRQTPIDSSLVLAYGAAGVGYIIPATYLPVMAQEIVRSPLVFGWSWPVFGFAAFISTLMVGPLRRRYPNRRIWGVSQSVMAFGTLVAALSPGLTAIAIAALSVGGTFMVITMEGLSEVHRIAPAHDATRHIAVMTAAFAAGQVVGPLLAGLGYDLTGGFSAALVITSVFLAITVLPWLTGPARREYRQP